MRLRPINIAALIVCSALCALSLSSCGVVQVQGEWKFVTGVDAICYSTCTLAAPVCFSTESNADLTVTPPQARPIGMQGEEQVGSVNGRVTGQLKYGFCPGTLPLATSSYNLIVDVDFTYRVLETQDTPPPGFEDRCYVSGQTMINYNRFEITAPPLPSGPFDPLNPLSAIKPPLEQLLKEKLKAMLERELYTRLHQIKPRNNIYCRTDQAAVAALRPAGSISCACPVPGTGEAVVDRRVVPLPPNAELLETKTDSCSAPFIDFGEHTPRIRVRFGQYATFRVSYPETVWFCDGDREGTDCAAGTNFVRITRDPVRSGFVTECFRVP
jgi:hypothetical protein